jgi:hypothetical protein
MEIIDTQGRTLQRKEMSGQAMDVPTAGWRAGLYLIRIRSKGVIGTRRMVVTN